MGRPKTKPDTTSICFRVTEVERDVLSKIAKKSKLSLSEHIREKLGIETYEREQHKPVK
jgi:hypothetical protein